MADSVAGTRGGGNRSPLSLAGDACWPVAVPGGRSPVRERERGRQRGESEREIAWVRERVRDVGVLFASPFDSSTPSHLCFSFFFFFFGLNNIIQLIPGPELVSG